MRKLIREGRGALQALLEACGHDFEIRMLREGKFKKYTALYGRCRLILRREESICADGK